MQRTPCACTWCQKRTCNWSSPCHRLIMTFSHLPLQGTGSLASCLQRIHHDTEISGGEGLVFGVHHSIHEKNNLVQRLQFVLSHCLQRSQQGPMPRGESAQKECTIWDIVLSLFLSGNLVSGPPTCAKPIPAWDLTPRGRRRPPSTEWNTGAHSSQLLHTSG